MVVVVGFATSIQYFIAMCILKMRNMSLWQLGPIITSSYFKRGGKAVRSIGNPPPPDGAYRNRWLWRWDEEKRKKIWMWWCEDSHELDMMNWSWLSWLKQRERELCMSVKIVFLIELTLSFIRSPTTKAWWELKLILPFLFNIFLWLDVRLSQVCCCPVFESCTVTQHRYFLTPLVLGHGGFYLLFVFSC